MPTIKKFNLKRKNKQKRISIINQVIYHAPNLIKKKSKQIIETVDYRINNLSNEQQNVRCLIRKIIRETIEAMYETSFDLFGKFGIQQFKKIIKHLKKRQIEKNHSPFTIELLQLKTSFSFSALLLCKYASLETP